MPRRGFCRKYTDYKNIQAKRASYFEDINLEEAIIIVRLKKKTKQIKVGK